MRRWPRGPVLYLVTDRTRLPGQSVSALLERLRVATLAGIDAIQIRERDLSDRVLVDLVRRAVAAAHDSGVPVLVNDRLDVALAAGAAGVHLREDSVRADRVRAVTPPGFVLGRSVHSAPDGEAVARTGACDYLLFGTVYPSAGKPPGHPVAGEVALAEICRRVTLPVIAIGGIDETRASAVAAAGAAGVAAIGAFMTGDAGALASRVRAMRAAFDTGSRLV